MKKIFGFFRGLFFEGNKNTLSIGRILLWISVVFMCLYWKMGLDAGKTIEVPESLLYSFYALLGYNLSKKLRDVLKLLIEFKHGPQNNQNNYNNRFYNNQIGPRRDRIDRSDILMED